MTAVKRQKTIVIALGGNAIIRGNQKGTYEEQYSNLRQTSQQLLELLRGEKRITELLNRRKGLVSGLSRQ